MGACTGTWPLHRWMEVCRKCCSASTGTRLPDTQRCHLKSPSFNGKHAYQSRNRKHAPSAPPPPHAHLPVVSSTHTQAALPL